MAEKDKLSKKEKGFAEDFVLTGNGVQSALKNYDTKDYSTAGVIAHENLKKPKIQKAISELIDDNLLAQKHRALFEQKQLAYFVFSKDMENEEIKYLVESNGLKVINIKISDKGKLAFYSIDDVSAITKALDMGYKLKGSYAAEKKEIIGDGIIPVLVQFLDNKNDSTSNNIDTN